MASRAEGPTSVRESVPDNNEAGLRLRIARYELFEKIASGGMATVYFGRLRGGGGFKRAVALKRLHPHLASEKRFVAMLRDEARLASRIRHRSVVPVLDVVETEGELLLVMELVEGPSLNGLLEVLRKKGEHMPLPIAGGIMRGVMAGLRAAHESTDESGAPLDLVHRDVSPHNVILGIDGIARVADFGIAKARGRNHTTQDGSLKGNFGYMAPEQAKRKPVTPRTDLYAAGVLLWECLTGKRMHADDEPAAILTRMLYEEVPPVSDYRDVSPAVDALLKRALSKEPDDRFTSAAEMSEAIGEALGTSGPEDVARFLRTNMPAELADLRARIERVENAPLLDEDVTGPKLPPAPSAGDATETGGRVTAVVHDISIPPPKKAKARWIAPFAVLGVALGAGGFAMSRRTTPPPVAPATATTVTNETPTGVPVTPAPPPASAAASNETQVAKAAAPVADASVATAPAKAAPRARTRPRFPEAEKPSKTGGSPPVTAPAAAPSAGPAGLEGIPRERE